MMKVDSAQRLLLVSVGNSRTRYAVAHAGKLEPSSVADNAGHASNLSATIVDAWRALVSEGDAQERAALLIASVNDPVADGIESAVRAKAASPRIYRLGSTVGVPLMTNLPPPLTVGTDRLLAALGAYARSQEACVVIDAGTAITVDLVDRFGVFQGGCIAPGLRMMLDSLHTGTAQLPKVEVPAGASASGTPGSSGADADAGAAHSPIGKTTIEAMQRGCLAAARGLARLLIDQYAEHTGSYPRVVATGGDAPLLFSGDDLVEHIVPDLVLVGMLETWNRLTAGEE